MALKAPSASQVRTAKIKAVGGARKRCVKGKSCSATCIAANEDCLVELPEPISNAMQKARDNLAQGEATTTQTGPLTGGELIDFLKSHKTASKSDLMAGAGYDSMETFYTAVLKAKEEMSGGEKPQEDSEKLLSNKYEREALKNYTKNDQESSTGYYRINETLREGEDPWTIRERGDSEMADSITSIDNALGSLPGNVSRQAHFRGVSVDSELDDEFKQAYSQGSTFEDPAYGSFSSSKSVAKEFYNSGFDDRVLFVSKSPQLKRIAPFSDSPHEEESLLPRGTEQRVDWVKETSDPDGRRTLVIGVDYFD